jgi:hypothetical protein
MGIMLDYNGRHSVIDDILFNGKIDITTSPFSLDYFIEKRFRIPNPFRSKKTSDSGEISFKKKLCKLDNITISGEGTKFNIQIKKKIIYFQGKDLLTY